MSLRFFEIRSPMIPRAKNMVAIVRSAPESISDCTCPVGPEIVKKKYKKRIIPITQRVKNTKAKLKKSLIG